MLQEHASLTSSLANNLFQAIEGSVDGRITDAKKRCRLIDMAENEVDAMGRKIISELAKGEIPPTERGDLMRLTRRVDMIADWAQASSRILALLMHKIKKIWEMSRSLGEICVKMGEKVKLCVAEVLESINFTAEGDIDGMLSSADRVERIEEEVDALYQKARKEFLASDEFKVNVGVLIVFSQFLDALENTADRCEDVCDQIRVIALGIAKKR
jgi:predicted phosphate transport protein (TIGR00153 family)